MKKKLKAFFIGIGSILSYILPYRLYSYFIKLRGFIFSGYLKRQFGSVGLNFNITPPTYMIGGKYISIGKGFNCFSRLRLEAYDMHLNYSFTPVINIGDDVSVNFDCHIACINHIEIGNNVLIASKVFITDHFHGEINSSSLKTPPSQRKVISKGPVIIKDNVWIGEGAIILPNVTIGKNSIIGANAVVTKSFPANSVIAGNPAKLIKILQ